MTTPADRCTVDHKAAKQDLVLWAAMRFDGFQKFRAGDDGPAACWEVRTCACGTTLYLPLDPSTFCVSCAEPAHASETDDAGRCAACVINAGDAPICEDCGEHEQPIACYVDNGQPHGLCEQCASYRGFLDRDGGSGPSDKRTTIAQAVAAVRGSKRTTVVPVAFSTRDLETRTPVGTCAGCGCALPPGRFWALFCLRCDPRHLQIIPVVA